MIEPVVIERNGVTCTLHNCDCMDLMRELPDRAFDLAIVDPPYGIGNFNQSDAKQGNVSWNNSIPDREYFNEIRRVSNKQIVWGSNYYGEIFGSGGVLVWHKGPSHPAYSQVEIAAISWQKRCDYVRIDWQSGFYRTIKEGDQIHPCQKPVALYSWLLANYAEPGQTILDTHLGSGSIAIACLNHGYNLTACELDADYFKAATERIQREANQGVLI